jgi:hypothetical protein
MASNLNVPADWNAWYETCEHCGKRYHASDGFCGCAGSSGAIEDDEDEVRPDRCEVCHDEGRPGGCRKCGEEQF